jgi:hypothetical protein
MPGQDDKVGSPAKSSNVKSPFEVESPYRPVAPEANLVEKANLLKTPISAQAPPPPPLPWWRRILQGIVWVTAILPGVFGGVAQATPHIPPTKSQPEPHQKLGDRTVSPKQITIVGLERGDAIELQRGIQKNASDDKVTMSEREKGERTLVDIAIGVGTGISFATIKLLVLWTSKRRARTVITSKRTIGFPDGTSVDDEVTVTVDVTEPPKKKGIDAIAKALGMSSDDLKEAIESGEIGYRLAQCLVERST